MNIGYKYLLQSCYSNSGERWAVRFKETFVFYLLRHRKSYALDSNVVLKLRRRFFRRHSVKLGKDFRTERRLAQLMGRSNGRMADVDVGGWNGKWERGVLRGGGGEVGGFDLCWWSCPVSSRKNGTFVGRIELFWVVTSCTEFCLLADAVVSSRSLQRNHKQLNTDWNIFNAIEFHTNPLTKEASVIIN